MRFFSSPVHYLSLIIYYCSFVAETRHTQTHTYLQPQRLNTTLNYANEFELKLDHYVKHIILILIFWSYVIT